MVAVHHHPQAFGLQRLKERVSDLLGQPLLELELVSKGLHDVTAPFEIAGARAKCEPNLAIPEEGKKVVLAEAEKAEVAHHDELPWRRGLPAGRGRNLSSKLKRREYLGHPAGSAGERPSRRGFAELDQEIADQPFDARAIQSELEGAALPMSERNSLLVACEARKPPSIDDVTTTEFCFSTPRIIKQRWRASTTTPTP